MHLILVHQQPTGEGAQDEAKHQAQRLQNLQDLVVAMVKALNVHANLGGGARHVGHKHLPTQKGHGIHLKLSQIKRYLRKDFLRFLKDS